MFHSYEKLACDSSVFCVIKDDMRMYNILQWNLSTDFFNIILITTINEWICCSTRTAIRSSRDGLLQELLGL